MSDDPFFLVVPPSSPLVGEPGVFVSTPLPARYTLADTRPNLLTITLPGGRWAMKFTPDGSLEVNPELTMDEAAKGVVEALRPYLAAMYREHAKS